MAQVLFISEQKLKENTAINEQVDPRELRTAILTTQDVNIQNTLGTRLYDQLKDLVESGDINQPANQRYKTLLNNFVVPLTIHYAYFYALDNFLVKFMAAGLVQNRTEQGSPIETKTFLILKNNARDTAQWYDNILRKHLCANQNLYPEYTIDNGDGKLIPERLNPFGKGMALAYPITCKDADLFYFGASLQRMTTLRNY